jgi:hypothetical protein
VAGAAVADRRSYGSALRSALFLILIIVRPLMR